MTTVVQYIAVGNESTKWALDDPVIAAELADKAGITAAEVTTLRGYVPKLEGAWAAIQPLDAAKSQATQTFLVAYEGVKVDVSSLRLIMKNNLPPQDPLFITLGFNEKQPTDQAGVLAYAVRAFSNGQSLSGPQLATLAKRKWDIPFFADALTRARAAQALNTAQEDAKAKAEGATAEFYNLVDEFDVLLRPFAKEARRVLANIPGALDKMLLTDGVPAKPKRPTARHTPKPPVQP